MAQEKRIWTRQTQNTVNTGARLPLEIVNRLEAYCLATGATKSAVIIDALNAYLPQRERGGSEE